MLYHTVLRAKSRRTTYTDLSLYAARSLRRVIPTHLVGFVYICMYKRSAGTVQECNTNNFPIPDSRTKGSGAHTSYRTLLYHF